MTLVLSDGNGTPPENASESPVALKKLWPWAPIWRNNASDVGSGLPALLSPHEQLICFTTLLLTIRLKMSGHGLGLGAMYRTTFDTDGAMEMTISMSNDTSTSPPFPLADPVAPSINMFWRGTFGSPARFS